MAQPASVCILPDACHLGHVCPPQPGDGAAQHSCPWCGMRQPSLASHSHPEELTLHILGVWSSLPWDESMVHRLHPQLPHLLGLADCLQGGKAAGEHTGRPTACSPATHTMEPAVAGTTVPPGLMAGLWAPAWPGSLECSFVEDSPASGSSHRL